MDAENGATHDWARSVDEAHLTLIRRSPGGFAPGGALHLVLEVLAYTADEAQSAGSGHCLVTLYDDGSVSVADNGRGTDIRHDRGHLVKKPVMSTKDLRFFDSPGRQVLPDGYGRRGMSVVAALSPWLVHVNRRRDGAWTQRYEHGIPVTDLVVADRGADGATGTTVHFLPDPAVDQLATVSGTALDLLRGWPLLTIEIRHQRAAH